MRVTLYFEYIDLPYQNTKYSLSMNHDPVIPTITAPIPGILHTSTCLLAVRYDRLGPIGNLAIERLLLDTSQKRVCWVYRHGDPCTDGSRPEPDESIPGRESLMSALLRQVYLTRQRQRHGRHESLWRARRCQRSNPRLQ